jgi:hypothetical protein
MSLREREFQVLRETIAARGTIRMALLPVTLAGWAIVAGGLLVFTDLAIAALFSLAILVGGFEAIHALHVGVERIGRYVQVYYESGGAAPRWESTAMRLGPGLPGGGIDPLFTVVFVSAALANMVVAIVPEPALLDLVALMALHGAFVVRIVRARGAAARQRAVDLEVFKALQAEDGRMPSGDADA